MGGRASVSGGGGDKNFGILRCPIEGQILFNKGVQKKNEIALHRQTVSCSKKLCLPCIFILHVWHGPSILCLFIIPWR